MRYMLTLLLIGLFACADQGQPYDGDVESMEAIAHALEEAPPPPPPMDDGASFSYQDEQTLDCMGGGTVLIKVQWNLKEVPYSRRYYVSWDYTSCVTWVHGTLDGKVRYSTTNEDKDPWRTGVNYFADLVYSGSKAAECDAYVVVTRVTEEKVSNIKVNNNCPHPVSHWWGMWW